MQHSKRLPGSTSPSTVYDVRALENEFSAEQQILSRPISYLLLVKMKCQNVTLIPVRNLISGKNLIKRNTSGEKAKLGLLFGKLSTPFLFFLYEKGRRLVYETGLALHATLLISWLLALRQLWLEHILLEHIKWRAAAIFTKHLKVIVALNRSVWKKHLKIMDLSVGNVIF